MPEMLTDKVRTKVIGKSQFQVCRDKYGYWYIVESQFNSKAFVWYEGFFHKDERKVYRKFLSLKHEGDLIRLCVAGKAEF